MWIQVDELQRHHGDLARYQKYLLLLLASVVLPEGTSPAVGCLTRGTTVPDYMHTWVPTYLRYVGSDGLDTKPLLSTIPQSLSPVVDNMERCGTTSPCATRLSRPWSVKLRAALMHLFRPPKRRVLLSTEPINSPTTWRGMRRNQGERAYICGHELGAIYFVLGYALAWAPITTLVAQSAKCRSLLWEVCTTCTQSDSSRVEYKRQTANREHWRSS